MAWLDPHGFPLWLNLGLFVLAGAAVWFAGVRLARYADIVADRASLGEAFVGALLLGGITSLPEVATTVTASFLGNPSLAVNNVFGSVAMNVAILTIADIVIGKRPLSSLSGRPIILLQGVLVCVLLGVVVAGVTVGEFQALPVGLWSTGILVAAVAAFYLMHSTQSGAHWEPQGGMLAKEDAEQPGDGDDPRDALRNLPNSQLALRMAAVSLVVLVAGFVVTQTGEALAEQTGLGSSLAGFVLIAITTSLPELSTTLTAARLGAYGLAFSNIFGTNVLTVALIFLVDAVYAGGPVLNGAGQFAVFGAVLGMLVTLVYVAGIIERRDAVIWRFGPDSLLVLLLYSGGLVLLYQLGGQ